MIHYFKQFLLPIFIVGVTLFGYTQTPDLDELSEMASTSDGVSIPPKGTLHYDNSTNEIWYYNGTIWKSVQDSTIYTSNAKLTDDRIISLEDFDITFNGNEDITINNEGKLGIGIEEPTASFHNNGTLQYSIRSFPDVPTGGVFASAENSVDIGSVLSIEQTTLNQILTLPEPAENSPGKIVRVVNSGTAFFNMYDTYVQPNTYVEYLWDGSKWIPNAAHQPSGVVAKNIGNISTVGDELIVQHDNFKIRLLKTGAHLRPSMATVSGTMEMYVYDVEFYGRSAQESMGDSFVENNALTTDWENINNGVIYDDNNGVLTLYIDTFENMYRATLRSAQNGATAMIILERLY